MPELSVPPTLLPGETYTFTTTVAGANGYVVDASPYVHWTSFDPQVATVSNERGVVGRVTAVAPGSTPLETTLRGATWTTTVNVVPQP